MTAQSELLARLRIAPNLPEAITRIDIWVNYSEVAIANDLPQDRKETWEETLEELTALLKIGFLSRPSGKQTQVFAQAELETKDRLRISLQTPGTHMALITVLLRLIHSTHQTPAGAYEALLAALDFDEAAAQNAFGGMIYSRDVAMVSVNVVAAPNSAERPFELQQGHLAGMVLLADGPLAPEPVIDAQRICFAGLELSELSEDLEDNFLNLSGACAFLPFDAKPEFEPGNESIYLSEPDKLTIDEISIEQPILFELLTCLHQGNWKTLTGSVEIT